jgi:Protein of unknown function (DUF3703)
MLTRKKLPEPVREAISRELALATSGADDMDRWRSLERAHILSQPWPWPHTVVHWRMLRVAVGQRDRREALGQVLRLVVAAPGSVSGRYPQGNTGRASVGLLAPMPVPDDLAKILGSAL